MSRDGQEPGGTPPDGYVKMNTFVKHWREGLQELGYSEDEVTIKIVRAPESPIGWGIIFSSPDRETMEHIAELYAAYEEWTEDEDDDDPE